MLTFNIYTGVLQRRRRSWTAFPFFFLWWVLCFVSFAALLFTDYTELDHSGFPPEDLKISGDPATPTQLLSSINPATAQAILARAARAQNRGKAQPTALFATNTTTPTNPNPNPIPTPVPAGAAYSDSDEDEPTMATTTTDPMA